MWLGRYPIFNMRANKNNMDKNKDCVNCPSLMDKSQCVNNMVS